MQSSVTQCFATACHVGAAGRSINRLQVPRSSTRAPALLRPQPCWNASQGSGCSSPRSNTASSRLGLSTCSALSKGDAQNIRYGWRKRGLASGALESCLAQVKPAASKGSSWVPQDQQRFLSAARAVGGVFLLVQSGMWAADHPRAGQPALAILHIVCCVVEQQDVPGSRTNKKMLLPPQLLREPVEAAPDQYYYLGAFMLDGNGWPTAELYNRPSSFEALTTRKHFKRPASINVVWEGEPRETVERWCKHNLVNIGVKKAPPTARYVVTQWYHKLMESAGARVEWKDDAPAIAKKHSSK